MNRLPLYLCILAAASFHSFTSAAEPLPPSLRACMSEQDDARRLSCFDRESARLPQGDTPAVAPAAARAPVAAAPAPEEKFGYRGSIARQDVEKRQAEERQFDELTSKVVELTALPRGELVLTLENGQMWAQKAADRAVRVKVGDEVTIKRASMGSFLLSTSAKGSMRVTRLK